MRSLPSHFRAALCIAAFALAFSTTRAVEVYGGNINTTAPGTVFDSGTFAQALPWYNVGQLNGSSAVYLGNIGSDGNYWVISASHVAPSLPSSVVFNSGTYNTVAGSFVQLQNPDSSLSDMVLFRININADPVNLVTLTLESTTPAPNTPLYFVGNGGGVQRWGSNNVLGYGYFNDGFGNMLSFTTDYTLNPPDINEGQGIGGDSGGAAFFYNGTSWELGGMMYAADLTNTPNITYSADIASYHAAIISAIPEPGVVPAFFMGACALLVFTAMKKRRAQSR